MRHLFVLLLAAITVSGPVQAQQQRYLYVATPGVRDYLGYGGHGVLVFDISNHHRFVKRIRTGGFHGNGEPSNVKGIAVSIPLNSLYVSTLETLERIDLTTDSIVWEKKFEGGCDRMAISPDGMTMYLPSLENTFWNVVDCKTGAVIRKIPVYKRAHNTIFGRAGDVVYLDDLSSPWLFVADAHQHQVIRKVGPFSNNIRPFTVNGKEDRVYVTVDSLLGFEIGDLKSGTKIATVAVMGWEPGYVKRHGDPSHGIGLTPDEKEIWLCDGHNMRLHVFSAKPPYQQLTTIPVQDLPGWITFSIDGRYAYPSSGEVIDVQTRRVLMTLKDEHYNSVQSEKMVEIDFNGRRAVRAGNQFGIGAVTGR
jgi:DNA-binding beta-propeller fold protein YncE